MDYDFGLLRRVQAEPWLRRLRPDLQRGMRGRKVHGAERVQLFARMGRGERRMRALLRATLPEGRLLLLAQRVRLQIGLRGGGRGVQADLSSRMRERRMRGAPRVQMRARIPARARDGGGQLQMRAGLRERLP